MTTPLTTTRRVQMPTIRLRGRPPVTTEVKGKAKPSAKPPEPAPTNHNRQANRSDHVNQYQQHLYCQCDRPMVFAVPTSKWDEHIQTCTRCGRRTR